MGSESRTRLSNWTTRVTTVILKNPHVNSGHVHIKSSPLLTSALSHSLFCDFIIFGHFPLTWVIWWICSLSSHRTWSGSLWFPECTESRKHQEPSISICTSTWKNKRVPDSSEANPSLSPTGVELEAVTQWGQRWIFRDWGRQTVGAGWPVWGRLSRWQHSALAVKDDPAPCPAPIGHAFFWIPFMIGWKAWLRCNGTPCDWLELKARLSQWDGLSWCEASS